MANSNPAVTILAIVAIVILVGLVIYFVSEETNDDIEIDLGAVPVLHVTGAGLSTGGATPELG